MSSHTIGSLAKQAGVGVETVRFYERRGLVRQPPRPSSGYRIYTDEALKRIRFVRNAQALGFSLQEIKDLLALRQAPANSCTVVKSRAAAKAADVARRVKDLQWIQAALERLATGCPGSGSLDGCAILAAFDSEMRGAPMQKQRGLKRWR